MIINIPIANLGTAFHPLNIPATQITSNNSVIAPPQANSEAQTDANIQATTIADVTTDEPGNTNGFMQIAQAATQTSKRPNPTQTTARLKRRKPSKIQPNTPRIDTPTPSPLTAPQDVREGNESDTGYVPLHKRLTANTKGTTLGNSFLKTYRDQTRGSCQPCRRNQRAQFYEIRQCQSNLNHDLEDW